MPVLPDSRIHFILLPFCFTVTTLYMYIEGCYMGGATGMATGHGHSTFCTMYCLHKRQSIIVLLDFQIICLQKFFNCEKSADNDLLLDPMGIHPFTPTLLLLCVAIALFKVCRRPWVVALRETPLSVKTVSESI